MGRTFRIFFGNVSNLEARLTREVILACDDTSDFDIVRLESSSPYIHVEASHTGSKDFPHTTPHRLLVKIMLDPAFKEKFLTGHVLVSTDRPDAPPVQIGFSAVRLSPSNAAAPASLEATP